MNTQLAGRSPRRRQGANKTGAQHQQSCDHAEIVHMAEVEAANREIQRRGMIEEAAYFRAEKRGFAPGHELEDWLAAEVEVANAQQLSTLSPSEATGLRRVS